jgi:hypothetical protein
MRLPGYLQFGVQARAHQFLPCVLGKRDVICRPQPWPDGLVAGKALGLGSALPERLLGGLGPKRAVAWGLGHGQQRWETSTSRGSQPAPHGMAMDPQPLRHLRAGAGLLGL